MKHRWLSLALAAMVLLTMPVSVFARALDYDRPGSITVALTEQTDKTPISGAQLRLYQVATAHVNTAGNLNYIYTEEFESCAVPLEDPQLVTGLESYISGHSLTASTAVTDGEGKVSWTGLPPGLYLVRQTNSVDGFAPCKTFLVTVPMDVDGTYVYDVTASPKTEVERLTDITIQKKWNVGKNGTIPGTVSVQLLLGDEVIETVVLNARNQWKVTLEDLPVSDDYTIKETKVPAGFTATYSQKGFVFTVTNTSSLIQTGQRIWPIPVFAVAGLVLLTLGAVLLRRERT